MSKRRSTTVERPVSDKRSAEKGMAVPVPPGDSAAKRVADAVIDACCLLAVMSLPLYFSVLTNTGYEPDKAALIRVLAAVAAGAWLVSRIGEGRSVSLSPTSKPLLWLGIVVFAAYGLATLLSIDPRLGLFGSQLRQEGLMTRASYLVFLVCAATRLRGQGQIERLITVLLFGSIPAVFYGFVQQFGVDPIPSAGDVATLQWPVRSTFGQHVFFGSYLVMVIPFTAARLIENWQRRNAPPEHEEGYEVFLAPAVIVFALAVFWVLLNVGYHRPSLFALFPAVLAGYTLLALLLHALPDSTALRQMRLTGYAILLAVQVLILALSGARGPWIGCFAALPVFGFLVAWWLHRPRIWQSVLGVSLAGAIFIVVLNIPNGPLQPLRTVHGMTRIADITESGGTEVGSVKGRLLIWQGVADLLKGHPAIGNTWGGIGRDVVGYGPESMRMAFETVFPIKLRRATFEVWWWDRAHDIYLDYLVDAGVIALLGLLAVTGLFFWRVLQLLRSAAAPLAWVLIAMASAVAGHMIDGLFGLETVMTLILFWIFVGLVAGLGSQNPDADEARPPRGRLLTPAIWFWAGIILVGNVLALFLSEAVPSHPHALAAFWTALCCIGIGVIALSILPVAEPTTSRPQASGKKRTAQPVSIPRRSLLPLLGVGLACAVVLASQTAFVSAAIADRSGTTSFALGQQQQAVTLLQQAAQASPYEPLYRSELGAVYRTMASAASTYSANPGYRPSGNAAFTVDPQSAISLNRNQLFALSIGAFESARSLAPLEADLYASLGDTYRMWKHPGQAVAQYRQAQRLSHANPRYVSDEALAYVEAGRPQEARRRAGDAVRLDSSYWYSHFALARAYHALGQPARARSEAQRALFWVPVFKPAPAPDQIKQLHQLERNG